MDLKNSTLRTKNCVIFVALKWMKIMMWWKRSNGNAELREETLFAESQSPAHICHELSKALNLERQKKWSTKNKEKWRLMLNFPGIVLKFMRKLCLSNCRISESCSKSFWAFKSTEVITVKNRQSGTSKKRKSHDRSICCARRLRVWFETKEENATTARNARCFPNAIT